MRGGEGPLPFLCRKPLATLMSNMRLWCLDAQVNRLSPVFVSAHSTHGSARGLLLVPERYLQPHACKPGEAGAVPPTRDSLCQDHRVRIPRAQGTRSGSVYTGNSLKIFVFSAKLRLLLPPPMAKEETDPGRRGAACRGAWTVGSFEGCLGTVKVSPWS